MLTYIAGAGISIGTRVPRASLAMSVISVVLLSLSLISHLSSPISPPISPPTAPVDNLNRTDADFRRMVAATASFELPQCPSAVRTLPGRSLSFPPPQLPPLRSRECQFGQVFLESLARLCDLATLNDPIASVRHRLLAVCQGQQAPAMLLRSSRGPRQDARESRAGLCQIALQYPYCSSRQLRSSCRPPPGRPCIETDVLQVRNLGWVETARQDPWGTVRYARRLQ